MNTLLYDRVSTDQQNMQRQDYMLAREVERLGAPVLESFMDPDVSGSMTMRERAGHGPAAAAANRRVKCAFGSSGREGRGGIATGLSHGMGQVCFPSRGGCAVTRSTFLPQHF